MIMTPPVSLVDVFTAETKNQVYDILYDTYQKVSLTFSDLYWLKMIG